MWREKRKFLCVHYNINNLAKESNLVSYTPYITKLNTYIKAYIHDDILKDPIEFKKVTDFLENEEILNKLPRINHYNLYFRKEIKKTLSGAFYDTIPDSVFLYPTSELNQNLAGMKYTILHESYHALQGTVLGCGEKETKAYWNSPTFDAIIEGGADHFAYSNLDDTATNRKPYLSMLGQRLTDREFAVLFDYNKKGYPEIPLSLTNDVSQGIFKTAYSSRILFDNYRYLEAVIDSSYYHLDLANVKLDSLELLRYFNVHKSEYNDVSDINFGKKLIKDFSNATNLKLDQLLLSVVDTISNQRNPWQQDKNSSAIIPYLQDPNLFTWNDKSTIYLPNNDASSSGTGATKIESSPGQGLNIASFGGVSKNIFIDQPGHTLNHNYLSLVTFDQADNPDLNVQFILDRYSMNIVPYEILTHFNFGNTKSAIIGGEIFNAYDTVLRLNIANAGLQDTKLNLKIQPLCKEYQTPGGDLRITLTCPGNCLDYDPIIFMIFSNVDRLAEAGYDAPDGAVGYLADWFAPNQTPPEFRTAIWQTNGFFGKSATFASKALVCQRKINEKGVVDLVPHFTQLSPQ